MDRLTQALEVAARVVLAALILLKAGALLTEPAAWSRADPILDPLPMSIPILLALTLEAFVFFALGERALPASSKALCLAGFITLAGAYRVAGLILNGPNFSGCHCFGPLGRWLSGTASTALAAAVLALFALAALRYWRAAVMGVSRPNPSVQTARPVSAT
jgi:hypothetical protein